MARVSKKSKSTSNDTAAQDERFNSLSWTSTRTMSTRKKVAIVGSGCAGLGAAWALKHTEYEVHIFEKDSRLGGHTNTRTWTKEDESTQVDTGFIVMNSATYPNFIKFLEKIGVPTQRTEMTFGVSRDNGQLEWSGSGKGVFAQRRNLFRPGHWRMVFDIVRFNMFALDLLNKDDSQSRNITIGQYLDKEGYSQAFRDDYLIPMTAAVWSTSPDKASLEFPAQTLIRFMWNHHLLSTVQRRPDWLTIPGGAQSYIDAILHSFPKDRLHIHSSSRVTGLMRPPESDIGVRLYWRSGETALSRISDAIRATSNESDPVHGHTFDNVILACHGDEVLPILTGEAERRRDSKALMSSRSASIAGDAVVLEKSNLSTLSKAEQDIFSSFQTTENVCYLHSDLSLMPKREATWSSWNYMVNSQPSKLSHPAGVSLTYNMNILQHVSRDRFGHVLVTMNPGHRPNQDLTQGKYIYRHPLYTVKAVQAQEQLESIQNKWGVSFCGAWTKYGFHEDGFSSGLKVAKDHLGAKLPFEFKDSTFSRGHAPVPRILDHLVRSVLSIMLVVIRIGDAVMASPVLSFLFAIPLAFSAFIFDVLEHYELVS